jgi:2-methylisocitrate lyase-like PEP mutase family enzyme
MTLLCKLIIILMSSTGARLRQLLTKQGAVQMPGVFNAASALLVQKHFKCGYFGGAALTAS